MTNTPINHFRITEILGTTIFEFTTFCRPNEFRFANYVFALPTGCVFLFKLLAIYLNPSFCIGFWLWGMFLARNPPFDWVVLFGIFND